jgi:hypothetical protein
MANYPVNVTYGQSGFAFNPDRVTTNPGQNAIQFSRSGSNPTWTFHGISIWLDSGTKPSREGSICSPFASTGPSSDGTSLSVSDDNTEPPNRSLAYNYQVYVRLADGSIVSSDPQIINRG